MFIYMLQVMTYDVSHDKQFTNYFEISILILFYTMKIFK